MAITYINSATDSNLSATSLSVSDPTTTAEDDLYIAVCTINDDAAAGTWATPSGWTKLAEEHYPTAGTADLLTAVFYRFRGASAVGATSFSTTSPANNISVTISAYRGVNTTTPFDVTYVTANHYIGYLNNPVGANQPITTVTDGALVVLVWTGSGSNTAGTAGAPSGYSLDLNFNPIAHAARFLATKTVTTAGTETPGVWTHTSFSATADAQLYTLALRPAAADTRYIPSMEALYYGTARLDNKSGIRYAVISGHTNLNDVEPLAEGADMTTSSVGVPQFPGTTSYGALNDPVTVLMYWEEGSSPTVDRSLIVRTTLVAEA